jgi:hypothetical protein
MAAAPHTVPSTGTGRFERTWVLHEEREAIEQRLQSAIGGRALA